MNINKAMIGSLSYRQVIRGKMPYQPLLETMSRTSEPTQNVQ